MTILKDIVYKNTKEGDLGLDLFLPEKTSDKPTSIVFFIHGGAWQGGQRFNVYPERIALFEKMSVAVCSISYRLANILNNTNIYTCASDCINAIEFIVENSQKYNVDSGRMGISGHSAGGHLALICALKNRVNFGNHIKDYNYKIRCVTAYSPVCTFKYFINANVQQIENLFGKNATIESQIVKDISPIEIIDKEPFKILLIHGNKDEIVSVKGAREMASKAKKLGMLEEYIELDRADHALKISESEIENESISNKLFDEEIKFYKKYLVQ